ncbi:MAG: hypothetical protein RBS73_18230 [Prolixibacteraceae bacterium]|jgi:hypothetical protein|nr:hypothetical protein [Prolixibacteraceae bacterium]
MKQKFNFKTLPMLVAALTLADHFEAEKQTFVAENPLWADPFAENFRKAIEAILTEYYGISTREELKNKTKLVNELAGKAIDDLGMVKTQIERGFRISPERCSSLLGKLGFTSNWSKALHSNQSGLITLLFAFRNNLNTELRAELEQNGVNASRITNILSYTDALNQANITQEGLKGSSKLETEKAIIALNNIYDQAMDICLVGQQLFKKDKLKKELFVFTKLVKKQGTTVAGKSGETEAPSDGPSNS